MIAVYALCGLLVLFCLTFAGLCLSQVRRYEQFMLELAKRANSVAPIMFPQQVTQLPSQPGATVMHVAGPPPKRQADPERLKREAIDRGLRNGNPIPNMVGGEETGDLLGGMSAGRKFE